MAEGEMGMAGSVAGETRRQGGRRSTSGSSQSLALPLGLGALAAFAVRLWGMGEYGFWYDEGFSATMAAMSPEAILATVNSDVHPPLYYFLLKGWMELAGNGEFALRFLSLAAGVLTVVLTAKAALLIGGGRAAVLAGAAATLSPLLVAYAREARMYVFAGLWVTLAACLLLLALRRPRPAVWLAFAVAEAAALWTHYYTGLVLVALALVALAAFLAERPVRWRTLGAWALTQVAALASIAPLVQAALGRLGVYGSNWLAPPQASEVALAALRGLNVGLRPAGTDEVPLLVAGTAVVGLASVVALTRRETRGGAALALLWLAVATLPVLYAGTQRAAFHARYLVPVVPAVCLLLGLGLSRGGRLLAPSALGAALVFGVFAVGLQSGAVTAREDAGSVARYLSSVATERDAIIVDTDQPFRYYATRSPAPYVILPDKSPGDQNLRAWLDEVSPGRERVFHLQWLASFYDPREVLKYYLRTQTEWQGERRFAGFVVDEYRLPDSYSYAAPQFRPLAHSFAGALELTGAQLAPGRDIIAGGEAPTAVSNGLLPVALNWRLRAQPGYDLGAGLALVDAAGRAIASVVRPVVNAAHVYSGRWVNGEGTANYYLLPVPLGTLPGDYAVRAFVFRQGTAQRLDLLDAAGRPLGTEAEIGRVKVVSPLPAGREVPSPERVAAEVGPLALIDVRLDRGSVAQGGRLAVDLDWWTREKLSEDYSLALLLVPAGGAQPVAESLVQITEGRYPTSVWPAGERVRERQGLLVPGRTPAGPYVLVAGLRDTNGRELGRFGVGTVEVTELAREYTVPAIARPLATSFGGTIELMGYDVDVERLHVGRPLRLTLYWRALAQTGVDYTVFTHLLGPGDVVWGQQDRPPLDGFRPTAGWLPGEVLVDRYELALRPEAPPGTYSLEVGLYDPKTMARLPVVDASGRDVDSRVVVLRLPFAP